MENNSGVFNLSSEEFGINAINTLNELFEDQHFMNVTLACDDGKQIKAHKFILSSSSIFFKRILLKNPHEHPLIFLNGVKLSELEKILQFIYQGQTEVRQSDLDLFLKAARDLQIKGLLNHSLIQEDKVPEILNNTENDQLLDFAGSPPAYDGKTENYCDDKLSNKKSELDDNLSKLNCNRCDKNFSSHSGLWLHKKNVHQGVAHKCDHCGQMFAQKSHLTRHKKAISIKADKDLEIKGLVDQNLIQEEHIPEKPDNHTEADEKLLDTIELDQVTDLAEQSLFYTCETECKEDSVNKSEYGDRLSRYNCDRCDKKFAAHSGLWLHKKNVHEGILHNCNHCGLMFSQRSNLKRHTNNVHSLM
jgi:DNA-directed RNA polymerase subunit RPC12/RpoP